MGNYNPQPKKSMKLSPWETDDVIIDVEEEITSGLP